MTINSSIIALLLLLVISGISSDIFFIPVNLYSYPLLSSKILIRFLCRVFFLLVIILIVKNTSEAFIFISSHTSHELLSTWQPLSHVLVLTQTQLFIRIYTTDTDTHQYKLLPSGWRQVFFSFLEIPVNNDFFSTAAHWQILLYKLDLEFDGKSVKVNIWNRFCHTRHLKLLISKSTKGFLTGFFFLNQQPKTNKSIVSRQDSVTEKREGFYFGCTVTDRFSYNDSGCLKAALWIC